MINELCKRAHDNAVAKGFYETERGLPELLMLTVSELAEAMEAERKGAQVEGIYQEWAREYADPAKEWDDDCINSYFVELRGTIEEEIADACIRIFDLCGYYGIDLEAHILAKMAYNETRPPKHGKRY